MVIELLGGPLDGAIIEGPSPMPEYMVITSNQQNSIYRARCCPECSQARQKVPFSFQGYLEPKSDE